MGGFDFSVPYNNDFSLLERLAEIREISGNKISEIYLPIPQKYFGSGRIVKEFSMASLREVIEFCNLNKLKVNIVMNSTCEGLEGYAPEKVTQTIKTVENLYSLGVEGIIISDPLYIQKVKKQIPDLKVIASAFSDISSIQKATFFSELGADVLTLNDLNRDLETLACIKDKINAEIRLMVNEGCMWKCPLREFHNNFTSHSSKLKKKVDCDPIGMLCYHLRLKYPQIVFNSDWILPQWLKYYKNITNNFKIVGRPMPSDWIVSVTKNYLKEYFPGNLIELLESSIPSIDELKKIKIDCSKLDEKIFNRLISCNRNCLDCNYCASFMENINSKN